MRQTIFWIKGSRWAQRKEGQGRENLFQTQLLMLPYKPGPFCSSTFNHCCFKSDITLELFSSPWSSSEVKASLTFNPVIQWINSFALAFWNSFSKWVLFKVNFWVCFFTLASASVKHFCVCEHSLCIIYFSWVLIFSLFLKSSSSLSLNSRYKEH